VELNRNQFFMFGLVFVLLGVQLRMVDTFVLNEKASRFLAERAWPAAIGGNPASQPILPAVGPTPNRTLHPPTWLGFAVISLGSVFILHSMAMKRPGG
jgi:hypothetical protein